MDFNFSEEQDMLRELASEILVAEVTPERVKAIEASGEFWDEALWSHLAEANLLGLALPEEQGGIGFGVLELCILLEEAGRVVAPLPLLPTQLAAIAIARHGSDAQRSAWLSPVSQGKVVLGAALTDAHSSDPLAPATRATQVDGGYRLDGAKRFVQAAERAARILIPASVEGRTRLFLLDPSSAGVSKTAQAVTNREPVYDLELSGAVVAEADALPELTESELSALHGLALIMTCALQLGVSSRALQLTAEYASERVQFKQPIGSFQAVQHRCADNFIDLAAMRWTLWRAAWMLANGQDAHREAMVAKFWAAEGGARIASTAQHLHAGMGVDLDYPIHRYFIWTKTLELSLGSATPQLVRLGLDMARTGPQESI